MAPRRLVRWPRGYRQPKGCLSRQARATDYEKHLPHLQRGMLWTERFRCQVRSPPPRGRSSRKI